MKGTIIHFIKNSFYVLNSVIFSMIFNYFFHLYVSRALGPEEYGIYNTLISTATLVILFLGSINLVVAKEVVILDKEKLKDFLHQLLFFICFFVIILCILLFSSVKYISSFLHIKDLSLLFITFLIPITCIFLNGLIGVLQGLQFFRSFALVGFSSQFFRMIWGIFLVSIGYGVAGALLGSVLGFLFALFLAICFLKKYLKWPFIKFDIQKFKYLMFKNFFYSAYISAFSFLIYIDVPLVKHFFSDYETGLYSASALLGKVPIWLVGCIRNVLYPKIIEMKKFNQSYFHFYLFVILICFIGLILCASGFYFLAPIFIKILFGKAYLNAIPLLKLFALTTIPLSLVAIAVNYALATENRKFLYLHWICNFGFVFSMYAFHPSVKYAIIWLGLWSSIIFIGSFFLEKN